MPAATKSKPKNKVVSFYSSAPNLWVVRVPEDEIQLSQGGKQKIAGTSYLFVNHHLQVREGQDVLPDGNDPETGEPVSRDAVQYLRDEAAKLNPSMPEHFAEEQPVIPDVSIAYKAINDALISKDAEALTRILDEEQESHQREDVIDAAMRAFQSLDEQEQTAA